VDTGLDAVKFFQANDDTCDLLALVVFAALKNDSVIISLFIAQLSIPPITYCYLVIIYKN
jgi:hypothetical protein